MKSSNAVRAVLLHFAAHAGVTFTRFEQVMRWATVLAMVMRRRFQLAAVVGYR